MRKTRSAPASAMTTELSCWLIWEIGCTKLRLNCRNAARPPSVKPPTPKMASTEPAMAVTT